MNQYNQKSIYRIRKYTVGVVSVLATMTFLIGGHDAMASEQHTTQASSELARTEVTVSNQSLSEDTHTQSLPQKKDNILIQVTLKILKHRYSLTLHLKNNCLLHRSKVFHRIILTRLIPLISMKIQMSLL